MRLWLFLGGNFSLVVLCLPILYFPPFLSHFSGYLHTRLMVTSMLIWYLLICSFHVSVF